MRAPAVMALTVSYTDLAFLALRNALTALSLKKIKICALDAFKAANYAISTTPKFAMSAQKDTSASNKHVMILVRQVRS